MTDTDFNHTSSPIAIKTLQFIKRGVWMWYDEKIWGKIKIIITKVMDLLFFKWEYKKKNASESYIYVLWDLCKGMLLFLLWDKENPVEILVRQ